MKAKLVVALATWFITSLNAYLLVSTGRPVFAALLVVTGMTGIYAAVSLAVKA